METPTTPHGLEQFDHLPPGLAAEAAWNVAGPNPAWHEMAREQVRRDMPLLARALDRLTQERKDLWESNSFAFRAEPALIDAMLNLPRPRFQGPE